MKNKLSLLAVFAHPDDESCAPGATFAMYAHRGVDVSLVCVTRGERGASDDYQLIPMEQLGAIREKELACACKTLGIRRWTVLGLPDGGVARGNSREIEEELVRWIRKVQPQVVVTWYPVGEAGHPDHNAVSRAATRAYLGSGYGRRFPGHSRKGLAPWTPLKLYYAFPPDSDLASEFEACASLTVLDVSFFAETKFRAMRCHVSQKQCSQERVETLRKRSHFAEFFCLAHTRVSHSKGLEDDLFAGVLESEVVERVGGQDELGTLGEGETR